MQKLRKVPYVVFSQNLKNLLLVQKLQNKVFSKNSLALILSLYAAVSSCKKSGKLHALTFDST